MGLGLTMVLDGRKLIDYNIIPFEQCPPEIDDFTTYLGTVYIGGDSVALF